MPLPSDPELLKISQDIVEEFHGVFGKHPGFRTTHARGILLSGTFTPSEEAASLSSAPHFNQTSTPVIARFSSSTGIPQIPDNDPNANPRGIALRFSLGEHVHTDIITHSTPFFPAGTATDFLNFIKAVAASPPEAEHPSEFDRFLGDHPAALAFVQAPKPAPTSFAKETYYGVNAFRFVSRDGKATVIRYRFCPVAGEEHISDEMLREEDASFLYRELPVQLDKGPILFRLCAQIAEAGDPTNDATIRWPDSRRVVTLGTVRLANILEDNDKVQKQIIYDPIPRVAGIEPSDDPLLDLRAAVYLISGKQRRAA